MPLYNFECRHCGHRFEELVSYARRDEVRCPACGGEARVMVSSFAVGAGGGSSPAPVRSSGFS